MMSDEENKVESTSTETKNQVQPSTVAKTETQESSINTDDLLREIEAANSSLVSEDTRKIIDEEKKKAREEALKEMEAKQYLKEKEAEIAALKKAQEEKERETAKQLEEFKKKLNDLASSKQVVNVENPFKKQDAPVDKTPDILKATEEQLGDVEQASFHALLNRTREP